MNPFDQAWDVLKMPYTTHHWKGGEVGTYEGPLYSGGDIDDEPTHWTPDRDEALAYALFGSAIPNANWGVDNRQGLAERIPMRETRPQIRFIEDPGYDESGKPAARLGLDPAYSDAFVDKFGEAPKSHPYSKNYMLQIMNDVRDGKYIPQRGNTGWDYSDEERNKHIQGAIDRLSNPDTPPPVGLPEDMMQYVETAETDRMRQPERWG